MAVPINPENVLTRIQLLSLLSSALVVYRVGATYTPDQECNSKSFSVQLHATFAAHLSKRSDPPSAARAQLALRSPHARRLLLHTHTSAPFKSHPYTPRGLNLTLYVSQDCKVASLHLRVDWWSSLGCAGARYWTAGPGWGVGVVVWMLFSALDDTSVEVRPAIICHLFKRCNHIMKLQCLVYPNRSPGLCTGLCLGFWWPLSSYHSCHY